MQNPLPLLIFAHRGEAQSFLKLDNLIATNTLFGNLYTGSDYYLLITGEGFHCALEKVAACCGLLGQKIDRLINFGICGSLSDQYKIGEIISLRTIYFAHGEKLQFKSFTTADNSACVDALTVTERVLSPTLESRLVVYADLVEREAWACASVANLFKHPFYSYKYITDRVANNSQEICQHIKDSAEHYGQQLYQFYRSLRQTVPVERATLAPPMLEGFYFTASQQRKLASLLKSLSIKVPDFSLAQDQSRQLLQKIREHTAHPKHRTQELLENLEFQLNPFKKVLTERIHNRLKPLEEAHFQVSYDKQFESDQLKLTASIDSTKQIMQLIDGLKKFSWEDYQKIFTGQIDV